jgi:hypothetical protein
VGDGRSSRNLGFALENLFWLLFGAQSAPGLAFLPMEGKSNVVF